MFSSKLSRVAAQRATSTVAISKASTTSSPPTQQHLTCRSHQRRQSSSKASCPPDSSKPAPAAKAATSDDASPTTPSPVPSTAQLRGSGKRTSRYKRLHSSFQERVVKAKPQTDQFAGLQPVPTLQNLRDAEYSLSSFFSLHRPLSVNTTIPPPSSAEAFNSIFESRQERDPWEQGDSAARRPEDVIYTLHNTIESLENTTNSAQEEGVRWEVIRESSSNSEGIKHLDSAPKLNLEEVVARLKPFRAPPPPQAFPEERKAAERKRTPKQAKGTQQSLRQRNFTATIKITELTDPDGHRHYTASSSPIVAMPDTAEFSTEQTSMREPHSRSQQPRLPFFERMQRRQQDYAKRMQSKVEERAATQQSPGRFIRRAPSPSQKRIKMMLISVKRQRKLKMKKHKYKKLMKRTRTLRRKLDRT